MGQINRIEIKGVIGNIRVNEFEDNQVASISVVTNYVYKGRDGNGIVETMWFNVVAWKNRCGTEDLNSLKKGQTIEVVGRMREREYTGSDGAVRRITELVASKVELTEGANAAQEETGTAYESLPENSETASSGSEVEE